MHISLVFSAKSNLYIRLPCNNHNLLQAMVYGLLEDPALAAFLHDRGYVQGKRHFKLFCFSRIFGGGAIRRERNHILIPLPLRLMIASPVREILENLANGSLTKRCIRLGNNLLECTGVTMQNPVVEGNEVLVRTLSPILCYSTMSKADGSPFTVYHTPWDSDFTEQIEGNLRKKFALSHPGEVVPEGVVTLERVSKVRQRIDFFRMDDRYPLKGWDGVFRLRGPKALLQTAVDCGLGSKNSAGFGCVEIAEKRKRKEE